MVARSRGKGASCRKRFFSRLNKKTYEGRKEWRNTRTCDERNGKEGRREKEGSTSSTKQTALPKKRGGSLFRFGRALEKGKNVHEGGGENAPSEPRFSEKKKKNSPRSSKEIDRLGREQSCQREKTIRCIVKTSVMFFLKGRPSLVGKAFVIKKKKKGPHSLGRGVRFDETSPQRKRGV